ncbi:putative morc, S5 domain 2 protein [Helianthus anomalus]
MKCMCQRSPEYRNSTGSDGRGVIGVLEANFVEPAHDKQVCHQRQVICDVKKFYLEEVLFLVKTNARSLDRTSETNISKKSN